MKSLDDIAAQLQGYDPKALTVDAVEAFLAELVPPATAVETVPLAQALGRVLAADVISQVHVPPHDNSAMDGYAFSANDLQPGHPTVLRVVGTALAGQVWRGSVAAGECLKIMTGAVLPAGLDTVAPQELVQYQGVAEVVLPPGILQRGDNRRQAGEDLKQGGIALSAGQKMTPAACGLVASLGQALVTVHRRLKVAYFSTGDEILSLGEAPREGAVYDSNRYTLAGLLANLGCEGIDLGQVRDDPLALETTFRHAAGVADAIITSGGVSVGEADHTKAMMRKLGDVAFWRIAMRPGRPMAVGRIPAKSANAVNHTGAIMFGLPGNPVAVMVTFLAFVRPALLRMMGCKPEPPILLTARSLEAIRKKPGRTEYQRGKVSRNAEGVLVVRTTGDQGSGVLSSMVRANGLIVLHHHQGSVAPGDEVHVMMFDGVI